MATFSSMFKKICLVSQN